MITIKFVGETTGVSTDDVRAHAWLNLAAAQGDMVAENNKDIIGKEMTPAQLAEAEALSKKLCAKIPNCVR